MKKFHFSLETLLKIRNQRIKLAAGDLLNCAQECNSLLSEIEEIQELIKKAREEISMEDLKKYEASWLAYLDLLKEKESHLLGRKEKMHKELLTLQEKTTKALKEQKIVAKLKEKKYALWETEKENGSS